MESVGFRVFKQIDRSGAAFLDRVGQVAPAELADAMHETNVMDQGLRPVYQPMPKMVGLAVTVSIPRGSHFPMFKLGAQQTKRGDVLIVNARGDLGCGLIGGNICRGLQARGVAGVIVDGAVRDVEELRALQFPVYARGVVPSGGTAYGPGEVNVPIACGGIVVNPGDIVVADSDGIAVVPPAAVGELLEAVDKGRAAAKAIQPVLARGEVTNIESITAKLIEMGCKIE
jgi:4-hydroxy-4-methyl-2-oxoglutarate aldolase